MSGFGFLFKRHLLNRETNPITRLWSKDKNAATELYFPEYADIFEGNPPNVPVIYFEPGQKPTDGRPMVYGRTRPMEIAPWEFWSGNDGEITYTGKRWHGPDDSHNGLPYQVDVDEDEYLAWCHSRNFFRSGIGLDPRVFIDAVDIRAGDYANRKARFKKENLLVEPDFITCVDGIYLPARGPSLPKNPWGVNSSYHPSGSREPWYLSDMWGPDYRPDVGHGYFVWWDEERDGPKPAQSDYDKERYSIYL